jgi:TolB-like protein
MGDVIEDRNDIYGEGVNVAARLEGLAKPGGICVSEAVRTAVGRKLPLEYEFLGEQEVKNISEPVRAYHARLRPGDELPAPRRISASSPPSPRRRGFMATMGILALVVAAVAGLIYWQPWLSQENPGMVVQTTLPLPERPSIVVLPFSNLSDDSQQEYFADGMTDDLITDLSKISGLFVIARNSAFTYKGRNVNVQKVGDELGVKYVLEGSVRRSGDQVRINAQLIDANSGGHLWAERYDGSMTDVFALQDQVTRKIIAELAVKLTNVEQDVRERKGTINPRAYDTYLQGWEYYQRFTADDFVKAIPLFESAVELDPGYGQAYAVLASVYWITYRHGDPWSLKINPDNANFVSIMGVREKLDRYAELAMKYPTPLAHKVMSAMSWDFRQFDDAIVEAERAISLDPNDPDGYTALAWALIFSGRPGEAVESVEQAMRLDPLRPGAYTYVLGMARVALRQYEDALPLLERAHERSPGYAEINLSLMVAYTYLDRHEEAEAVLKKYSAIQTSSYERTKIGGIMGWIPFKREADIRHFAGALVKSGICCEDLLNQYIEQLRAGGTLH